MDAMEKELNQVGKSLNTTNQITNVANFNNNSEFEDSLNGNNNNNKNNSPKRTPTTKQQRQIQQRRLQEHHARAKKEAKGKKTTVKPKTKPLDKKIKSVLKNKNKSKTNNNTNLGTKPIAPSRKKIVQAHATKILTKSNKKSKDPNSPQQQPPTVFRPRGHKGPASATSEQPRDRGPTSNEQ